MIFLITDKDHAPAVITIGVHDFLYFISRLISSCIKNTDLAPTVVEISCQQEEHAFLKY